MRLLLQSRMILVNGLQLGFLLVLFGFSIPVKGQTGLSAAQTGTIQDIRRFAGYITISDRNYGFHEQLTQVFYNEEDVGADFLNEGLLVRFTLNRDSLLLRIEVLGPLANIQALEPS